MSETVPKVVRDGQVAVLVSPGFGAGWSTWGAGERGLFSPELVAVLERPDHTAEDLEEVAVAVVGPDCYLGGLHDLRIMWVPVGTQFRIHEYDGSESLVLSSAEEWFVA